MMQQSLALLSSNEIITWTLNRLSAEFNHHRYGCFLGRAFIHSQLVDDFRRLASMGVSEFSPTFGTKLELPSGWFDFDLHKYFHDLHAHASGRNCLVRGALKFNELSSMLITRKQGRMFARKSQPSEPLFPRGWMTEELLWLEINKCQMIEQFWRDAFVALNVHADNLSSFQASNLWTLLMTPNLTTMAGSRRRM